MTLGNRDTERSSNLLKEVWLKRTGKSIQVFPGCGACIERIPYSQRSIMIQAQATFMLFGPELLAGLRFQEPDVKFGNSPFQPFGPAFAERSSFAQFGFFFPQCLYKVAASFLASREVSHRARVFQLQAFGKFEPSPSKSWDSFRTHKVFFIDCCPFHLLPDL